MIRIVIKFALPSIIAGIFIYLAFMDRVYGPIYSSVGSIVMLYAIVQCGKSVDKQLKERRHNVKIHKG